VYDFIRSFVTSLNYFDFMSYYLKFDSGRSIGRAAVVILLVNLFEIKVRSELRGCGHTGHLMNDYEYILD